MNLLTFLLGVLFLQGSASLGGAVTVSGTSAPLAKVTIELRDSITNRTEFLATTEDDGTFRFPNVPPGRYRLVASRTGFLTAEYGQRRAGSPGRTIEVSPIGNPQLPPLDFALTPTASISGRVLGFNGRPIAKATVRALKPTFEKGARRLAEVQTTLTNDLGEYRLFWLPPGAYVLGARAPNMTGAFDLVTVNAKGTTMAPVNVMSIGGDGLSQNPLPPTRVDARTPADRFLPVYYPNTTVERDAQGLDLAPGANVTGINFLLVPIRSRVVRGVVIDQATGRPLVPPAGSLASITTLPLFDGATSTVNPKDGTFDIQLTREPVVVAALSPTRTGSVTLPAGDADIDGLRIFVNSGYALEGRVTIEGDATANPEILSLLRVRLRAMSPLSGLDATRESGVPSATGVFTLQNVTPDKYSVAIEPLFNSERTVSVPASLQNLYVKSIRLGDTDVLEDGLELGAMPPDNTLNIVLGANPGALSGSVTEGEVTVAVIPARRQRYDLYRSMTTDANGRFTFERVPPGDYIVFALDDADGLWLDPQFIARHESEGRPVTVREGDHADLGRVPLMTE